MRFLYNNNLMKRKEVIKKVQQQPIKNGNINIVVKTPKKIESIAQSKKAKPTQMITLDASEDDVSSQQKQEFLMLEIKQLKRENNFLKKKISELTMEYGPDKPQKKGSKQKGAILQPNLQILPLSINLFFEQIHNLLNTIVKLFRINFTQEQIKAHQQKHSQEIAQACPIKKHILLKKYYLKRKLERTMLQNEQQRLTSFLDLFTEYYQYKEESDNKIIEVVDKMTLRAHQLNEIVIKKAQEKKKSRSTFSMIRPDQEMQIEPLKIPNSPKNMVINSKVTTYSPANKKKKATKFAMSPTQRGSNNY